MFLLFEFFLDGTHSCDRSEQIVQKSLLRVAWVSLAYDGSSIVILLNDSKLETGKEIFESKLKFRLKFGFYPEYLIFR